MKITLKPRDFGSKTTAHCVLLRNAVSNTHWAIRREYIANEAAFRDEETAKGILGVNSVRNLLDTTIEKVIPTGECTQWRALPLLWETSQGTCRLFTADWGNPEAVLTGFNTQYLSLLDRNTIGASLWGRDAISAFQTVPELEGANFLMPMRLVESKAGDPAKVTLAKLYKLHMPER